MCRSRCAIPSLSTCKNSKNNNNNNNKCQSINQSINQQMVSYVSFAFSLELCCIEKRKKKGGEEEMPVGYALRCVA